MRQGDIFEDKTAMATLDTVESLYPGLPPSKNGSEIEMNMADAGGGIPLTPGVQLQLVIQRLKQMEMDK